jgi:hypothetical protein
LFSGILGGNIMATNESTELMDCDSAVPTVIKWRVRELKEEVKNTGQMKAVHKIGDNRQIFFLYLW